MKDAVGGSLLLNLVVIFTSVVILFFAGILAYSKAYKVKNKIIEVIERNDGDVNPNVLNEINNELTNVGYRVIGSAPDRTKCENDSSRRTCTTNLNTSTFNYCICQHGSANASVFEVITYVQFEFPVIGDILTFPVKGETKVLGKKYDY